MNQNQTYIVSLNEISVKTVLNLFWCIGWVKL